VQANTISPTFSSYGVSEWPQGHFDRESTLYLHRMPPEMVTAYARVGADAAPSE
jgi:hypothetical protein